MANYNIDRVTYGGNTYDIAARTDYLKRPDATNGVTDPTIMPQIDDVRANRLAFLPADQIIIEKTVDGGTTWTDAGISDSTKAALFAQTRPSVQLPMINGEKSVLCGLRVTFTAMKYNVPAGTAETQKYNYWNENYVTSYERYNTLREMYFWVSSCSDAIKVTVQRATGKSPNTWGTCFQKDNYGMTGGSGNDYIRFSSESLFGGSVSQINNYWNYRIIFMTAGPGGSSTLSGNLPTSVQTIYEIRGYGTMWWYAGNKMAASDHLYSWDYQKNATFPAKVTATSFIGDVTGNLIGNATGVSNTGQAAANSARHVWFSDASAETRRTYDDDFQYNPATNELTVGNITGKVNNHTVNKDVPSDAVFTDTTYENATASTAGLMSSDDKVALDALANVPLQTKTYTDVIATENNNRYGGFFYMKVTPESYNTIWHIKVHVKATVPSNTNYYTDSIFDLWGMQNTYSCYETRNRILSTSFRPFYYHSYFITNSTGLSNGCGHWIGFNFLYATNPTDTSLKRTFVVDLIQYDDCTVEMQNSLVRPDDIPNRAAHTGWYSSNNSSYTNFDACSPGLRQSGDANTTSISRLILPYGNYIMDSVLYRYQMLFEINNDTLTPLNNANNVTAATKTLLTNVEFNAFGKILYYTSSTTISANAAINGTTLAWQYDAFDIRYTFNIVNGDLVLNKPIYLKVTPTSGGMCKLASATPLTQTLPSTNDGYWYIFLGRVYSWYQIGLYKDHPVYMHDGTVLRELMAPGIVLKSLATKDSASGYFTPEGSVSAPTITVTPSTVSGYVASSATGGGSVTNGVAAQCTFPLLSTHIENGVLVFDWTPGVFTSNTPTAVTLPTFTTQTIVDGIESATSSTPVFTGTTNHVTVE